MRACALAGRTFTRADGTEELGHKTWSGASQNNHVKLLIYPF
jgi:hypothetical protein